VVLPLGIGDEGATIACHKKVSILENATKDLNYDLAIFFARTYINANRHEKVRCQKYL
jgi:hypothetical protein